MTGKSKIHKDDIVDEEKDDIEVIAENVGRYARKAFHKAQDVPENVDSVIAAIREEPVKASLIALGIGAVLGILLGRR